MAVGIGRRQFISVLGGAAAWPPAAIAQQRAMPVIGFLRSTSPEGTEHLLAAFRQGLKETGYVEGQNLTIEYRWAGDHIDQLPALAADLVHREVAVIVANGVAVRSAIAATATIPIVFVIGVDPVTSGFVANLDRPGGNITGTSIVAGADLHAKRLEILHELVPKATTIAALLDPKVIETEAVAGEIEQAARTLALQVLIVKAGSESEFDATFSSMTQSKASALLVGGGAFFVAQRQRLVALAAQHALPASYMTRDSVEVGGLMSYGPSQVNAYRRAGIYVGRILNGAKPAELPVELPTKYELVINLKTAKSLGLTVPPTLLAIADEVIE
jgi:putative tryptophan/tyrosine transport system substrate-binding protein